MRRKGLALLLALSMVLGNSASVLAADFDANANIEIEAEEADSSEFSDEDVIVVSDETASEEADYADSGISLEESDILIEEASDVAADAGSDEEEDIEITDAAGTSSSHILNYREVELLKPIGSPDVTSDGSYNSNSDYTAAKYVTPNLPKLRNQGDFGTCWAHASMALAEINLITKGIGSTGVDFSELHLSYFSYNHVTDPLGGTEGDYNGLGGDLFTPQYEPSYLLDVGGNLLFSQNVLASWMGAADESAVPYENASKVLSDYVATGKGLPDSVAYENVAHMTSYYDVTMPNYHYMEKDEETGRDVEKVNPNFKDEFAPVKKLIVDYGAVGISFNANETTKYEGESVKTYNEDNNAFYHPGKANTNHVVAVVGWDDNFSKDNFNVAAPGDGAWYVRNSWYDEYNTWGFGTNQCFEGYFWLSYYDDSVYSLAYAFDYTMGNTYDHNYQYDGTMLTGYDKGEKAANIFTIHGGSDAEILKAVSFISSDVNQSYKVEIYKNLTDANNPESGTLAATKTGTTTYEGYYTVPLDNGITMSKGDKFSVVLTFGKSENYDEIFYPIECSARYWYETKSSAKEGQSFLFADGKWTDYGEDKNSNIRIKAFTDESSNVPSGGISFDKTSYTVDQGDFLTPVVTVTPNNATNKKYNLQTSDKSILKVVDDTRFAALKAGTVTITAVSGNYKTTATVTVNATYTFSVKGTNNLKLGEESTFYIETNPAGAEIKHEVVYESTNPKVITIDSKTGKAKAVGIGYTYIKATIGCRSVEQIAFVSMDKPKVNVDIANDNTVTLTWKHVNGAEYYVLKDKDYKTLVEKLEPDANGNCSYVDKTYVGVTEKNYPVSYSVITHGKNVDGENVYNEDYIKLKINSKKYTITYVLSVGTNNSLNQTEYYEDSEIVLYSPTLPYGYRFEGWYTDSAYKNKKTRIEKTDKGDLTLYGKVTAYLKSHNIKYELNGGTNDPANPLTYVEGTTITLKDAIAPAGYKFDAWYSDKNFNTKKNQITATDKTDLTFYAKYIESSTGNDITYVIPAGTENPNPSSYSSKSALKLKKATLTGHTFGGWFKDSGYKKKVTSIKKGTKGPIVLYGKFTPIKYSVKFNGNGASNSMSPLKLEYGKTEELKANSLKKKGYSFKCWTTDKEGKGTSFADKATVTLGENLAVGKGKAVTLYAQWNIETYNITYVLDEGTNSTENPASYQVTDKTIKLKAPVKAGYAFGGWFKKLENGKYKSKVSKIAKGSAGDLILYAKWTPIKYTIKFNGNKATSGKMKSMTGLMATEKVTLTANEFKKDGYTFKGWTINKDGSGEVIADMAELYKPAFLTKNGQTVTLYAKWE